VCDAAMKVDTAADETCVSRWSSADHGFISGLMTESAELDASRLALTTATNRTSSIFPEDDDDACLQQQAADPLHMLDEFQIVSGPCVRRRRMSVSGSVYEGHRCRTRRRYSLSSTASSEYEYRESLMSKGFSVDLGEDLDGIMTPPSTKHGAGVTVAGMETLHHALKQIQRDVDEMNRKFDGLRTSAAINVQQTWSPADKSPVEGSMQFACGEPSAPPSELLDEDLSSERQQSDYIWDYRSDLVPEGVGHQFIALRPVVPSTSGDFVLHRISLPRDYSDLCTEASTGCGTDEGMVDLYIDDDIGGADCAVRERVPETFEVESQSSSADDFPKDKLDAKLSPGSIPTSRHSTQAYSCNSDVNCCICCHHPVECGHSDSCTMMAGRHCSSHCGVSALHTQRSSLPNHPCCHHHSHSLRRTRPRLSFCSGHGGNLGHCRNFPTALRLTRMEEWDYCNRNSPECYLMRSSTPADEIPPLDHCNNLHASSTSSMVAQRKPVGAKQDISKVIKNTFYGCTALQQVCFYCCLWVILNNAYD